MNRKPIPSDSALRKFDPFLDQNRLLSVGGRLRQANLESDERNPLIVPGYHHIAYLIISHHHLHVKHQGRLFTEEALRAAGL